MSRSAQFFFLSTILLISLCGCGGGGGGGGSSDPAVPGTPSDPAPPPVSGNLRPTADAGGDITVDLADGTVTLDGTASSDPEGADLTYSWTTPDGSLSGATPVFSFSSPEIYPITLVVNDGESDSAPAMITVTVADRILAEDFLGIENFREIFFVEGAEDGGFYLLGTIEDSADSRLNDLYLQKIAPDGTVTDLIIDNPNSNDFPSDLVEVSNGVVAVVGTVDDEQGFAFGGDLFFAIADLNVPEIVFSESVHKAGNDIITSIRRTDSGFLICGSSFSGSRQMRFLRYDYNFAASGQPALVWDILLNAPGTADYGVDALMTANNEILILGDFSVSTTNDDIYVAQLNVSDPQAPQVIRDQRISGSRRDLALALERTDAGYLVVGSTNSYGLGGYDILALRLDSLLNYSGDLSDYTFGGGRDDFSVYARRITPTTDGFLVAGATQSENSNFNGILLAFDSNGREQNLGVYNFEDASDEVALFAGESGDDYQLAGISGVLDFASPLNFSMGSPEFFTINIDATSMQIQ